MKKKHLLLYEYSTCNESGRRLLQQFHVHIEQCMSYVGFVFLCNQTSIDLCTYLGFGFLEAPREHVLHGPLLGISWLRLCPYFGAPTPEATLLRRRLFIVLMTAAHISPNVFSLQMSLASIYSPSYYSIGQYMHTYYTSHSHISYCITLCYMIHPSPSLIFTSSALPGRLSALGSLRPIH
jgi:hypothetical protein